MTTAVSRPSIAATATRTAIGSLFAAGLMFAALPALALDGDGTKDKTAEATAEACGAKEVCAVQEVAELPEGAVSPAAAADGMDGHPAVSEEERAAYEARAEACRIAQWHEGQGVPYDRFINDRNTMQRLRTDPFVVVQKSSGASRIKSSRERAGAEACEDLHEDRN